MFTNKIDRKFTPNIDGGIGECQTRTNIISKLFQFNFNKKVLNNFFFPLHFPSFFAAAASIQHYYLPLMLSNERFPQTVTLWIPTFFFYSPPLNKCEYLLQFVLFAIKLLIHSIIIIDNSLSMLKIEFSIEDFFSPFSWHYELTVRLWNFGDMFAIYHDSHIRE